MKTILLLLLFAISSTLHAQPPALAWARGVGGSQADYAESIATDASGAVYATGIFRGTVDFDPGPGTASLTATGNAGLFITKTDSTGTLLWARAVTSTTSATPFDMVVDGAGNVIIGGGFTGTVDFDPDATATASYNSIVTQLFILKLSTTGAFSWVATMGGGLARVQGVAVDAAGDVYAAGDFQNTIDFDPGAGTANLTSVSFNDIFVCKFSAAGAYQWAGRMGGGSADFGTSVAVDGSGVYVGGYFAGTADMDPGAGTSNLTSSTNDGFVVKLTTAGAFGWAAAFGGPGTDGVGSLLTTAGGDVFASGTFQGTADFDPGAGSTTLTGPASNFNAFVMRLSPSGALGWVRHLAATSGSAGAGGLAVDAAGDLYCTGSFSGTADMDPGSGTQNIAAVGTSDGFLCKLSGSGALQWAGAFGGAGGASAASDVALDAAGQICVGGQFSGTADLDVGAGNTTLTSAGGTDAFVAKYRASSGAAGVADAAQDAAVITLSPNPATASVTLRSPVQMQDARLRVLDATGRCMREWNGVSGPEFTADLSSVPAGVYCLEVATGAGRSAVRLVKR